IGDDFVKTMRQVQMKAVSKIEASFHDFVLEHAPEVRHEWVSATGPAGITLARLSRTFDLLIRSEEHTSELQSRENLVCRLLLECTCYLRDLHSFPTRRSSDLDWR